MRNFADDMSLLTDHIEYLIRCHDCVVLPGFGAFIAQYQSARVDKEAGRILPPCRCIAFNGSIVHNDGLLASSISRQLVINYDSAVAKITDEVNELRKMIYENGKTTFGTLGAFQCLTPNDGAIEFVPDCNAGNNAEVYHLQPVEDIKNNDATNSSIYRVPQSGVKSRSRSQITEFIKIAAALAVIAALALSLIRILPNHASEEVSYASLSPSHNTIVTPSMQEETSLEDISLPLLALPEGMGTGEYRASVAAPEIHYYIIVASFPSVEQALSFIESSKDQSLQIIEGSNRARVYAGGAASLQEAIAKSKDPEIAGRYNGVWVHRQ